MACALSKADLGNLRKAIALTRELDPEVKAALDADVPGIEEIVARLEHLKKALSQLLEVYEPIIREEARTS